MTQERIGGQTREEWQRDLMLLRKDAEYHEMVMRKAEKAGRPEIAKKAAAMMEAVSRIFALVEFLIDNYDWRGTKGPSVQ